MDANELLKGWPGWAKANAARVLASPAWRITTQYDGNPAVLTRGAEMPSPAISLSVKLNDAPKVVTFAPSPLFPDLWLLRDRLDALPPEVLLALVERECGTLFQFFEDLGRQSFSIEGVSDHPATSMVFSLATADGEVCYALDLSPEAEMAAGQLSNLDVTHESIRSLTREITPCHATIEMTTDDVSALQAGDCLTLPDPSGSGWLLEVPSDGLVRIVAPTRRMVTFAEIADDALGPVPTSDTVEIVRNGKIIAKGAFAKLGEAQAVKITDVRQET